MIKESFNILSKLKIKLIKIPSGEINNYDLLKKINGSRKKVILSTGMSNLFEIKKALKCLNKCEVILLHCVSEYPTLSPNLNNINLLQKNLRNKLVILITHLMLLLQHYLLLQEHLLLKNILHTIKIKK